METRTEEVKIVPVRDFTRTPGPRYRHEGQYSGEVFREEYVVPKFEEARREGKKLVVDLDETAGYASSFLEETFGGLVRLTGNPELVDSIVEVKSDTRPWYLNEVEEYISEDALDR